MSKKFRPLAELAGTLFLGTALGTALSTSLGCQPKETVKSKNNPTASILSQQDASRAFQRKDFQESLRISEQLLKDSPDSVPLLMLAGESATKLQQFAEALEFYRRVPDTASNEAATARWAAGEIHYHLGQPTACIDALESSLRINPNLVEARERLVWMLGVCGRRRELQPHLMALLRANHTSIETLLDMGNPWTENQNWQELERFKNTTPQDLLPNLVYARRHQSNGELEQAELLLKALTRQQPHLVAAHVQLGNLWLVVDYQKLAAWNAALPETSSLNADIWFIRGQWLEKNGDANGAIRCLFESLSIDPNHFLAQAALAQLLHQIGDDTLVKSLTERSVSIQQLNQTIDRIGRKNNYEPTIQQAAELTFQLGRYWEAIGWSQYGKSLNPTTKWHAELLNQILQSGVVKLTMPHTIEKNIPFLEASWRERFPMPVFPIPVPNANPNSTVAEVSPEKPSEQDQAFSFENIAGQAGIDFVFRNSTVDRTAGRRMFEFTGGGIGVIDYDNDSRPDLFLAQAVPWPIPQSGSIPGDALYRNLESRPDMPVQFRDSTEDSRIAERQFGQGVCVADINGDGFDDVYVANVGENQLWINQGDGTFADANSLFPADRQDFWTVSAFAADLDGNGLPEIYDVNYVTGEDVFTLRCDIGGKPRACPPLVFKPAPQQIWIPNNAGTFDAYDWGLQQLACNGLGAVAYRSVGEKLPRVFIAVDQQANILLSVSKSSQKTQGFTLEDTALLSGVAFDAQGQAQACMGIAAGDVDHNGEVGSIRYQFL